MAHACHWRRTSINARGTRAESEHSALCYLTIELLPGGLLKLWDQSIVLIGDDCSCVPVFCSTGTSRTSNRCSSVRWCGCLCTAASPIWLRWLLSYYALSQAGAIGEAAVRRAGDKRWRAAVDARFRQAKDSRLASAALACEKLINQATTRLSQVQALLLDLHCSPPATHLSPVHPRVLPFYSLRLAI